MFNVRLPLTIVSILNYSSLLISASFCKIHVKDASMVFPTTTKTDMIAKANFTRPSNPFECLLSDSLWFHQNKRLPLDSKWYFGSFFFCVNHSLRISWIPGNLKILIFRGKHKNDYQSSETFMKSAYDY